VRASLTALVADEEAERSVLTGSLVKALSYSGFGSVDIEGVVAIEPDTARTPIEADPAGAAETIDLDERRRARAAAERARLEAAVDRARRAVEAAEHQVEVRAARREEAIAGIADLERQLATARKRLEKVSGEHEDASGLRDSRVAELADAEAALQAHDVD
jgi:chromosome segregation ATPase